MRVVATIVSWNSMKYLPDTLASLASQTHGDLSVVIVDNGSDDGVEKFLREHHPEFAFIRNVKNLGFSYGHNQAIAYAKSRLQRPGEDLLILVTNPDIVLDRDYVARMVDAARCHPEAGSIGGKLLKARDKSDGEMRETELTGVIDSTGLKLSRSRIAVDRGSGEDDAGQYDKGEEVFGISGALALFRLSALEDVAPGGEYFDNDFFAYKEDIDLAWRLRMAGWKALYEPSAVAWHYRTAGGRAKRTLRSVVFGSGEVARRRKGRSQFVNYLSTRNHLLLIAKNDHPLNVLLHLPILAFYEIGKFAYVATFEPKTLRAYLDVLRLLPKIMKKRRLAKAKGAMAASEVRRWMK